MQNYLFRFNDHDYLTLFGMNYMNKNIDDINNLPEGLISATRRTLDASATFEDIHISKGFSGKIIATAIIRSGGRTLQLDTGNDVNPIMEIKEQTSQSIPEPEQVVEEPIHEQLVEETVTAPIVEEPEPIVMEESEPEPIVEEEVEGPELVTESMEKEETSKPATQEPDMIIGEVSEDMKPVVDVLIHTSKTNPIFLKRIDAYSLSPISMSMVKEKGDTYCEMNGWERVDDVYMIDDVVSVVRCVHSDTRGINMTIPYAEVANYANY